jgi:hypothetical protein
MLHRSLPVCQIVVEYRFKAQLSSFQSKNYSFLFSLSSVQVPVAIRVPFMRYYDPQIQNILFYYIIALTVSERGLVT